MNQGDMISQAADRVTGEKISKDYRDRYANFSKGAHFKLGGQGKSLSLQSHSAIG